MILRRSLVVMLALIAALATVSLAYALPPDNQPPTIATPTIQPSSPGPSDAVSVLVNVTDARSGVKNVTIVYTTDNWQSVNASVMMAYNATVSDIATAQIPSLASGGHIAYYIAAFDNDGNRAVNDNNGSYFGYDVPAPPGIANVNTLVYIGVLGAVGAAVSVMAYMILKKPATGSPQASSRTSREQSSTNY